MDGAVDDAVRGHKPQRTNAWVGRKQLAGLREMFPLVYRHCGKV